MARRSRRRSGTTIIVARNPAAKMAATAASGQEEPSSNMPSAHQILDIDEERTRPRGGGSELINRTLRDRNSLTIDHLAQRGDATRFP